MSDPTGDPNTGADLSVEPDGKSTNGTPRWVKAFGLVAVMVIVLLLVVALLTGGHGPGRHALSCQAGGDTPPSGVATRCVQQP